MRIFFTTIFCVLSIVINAQSVLFHENFDAPSGPDSVVSYNTNLPLNSTWNDTSIYAVSQANSYHTRIANYDSVIFETQSFSTIGNRYVNLSFQHIAKVHFAHRCYVQVSTDNGVSWINLTGTEYAGSSVQFDPTNYFNELSYPIANADIYWGGVSLPSQPPVTPTNNWWAKETFDISNIAGTISALGDTGFAQVKVRFIGAGSTNIPPVNSSGWYVDDVKVTGANCDLIKPQISFSSSSTNKPIGVKYGSNVNYVVKVADSLGLLKSGVSNVDLFYRKNGAAWQSIALTKMASSNCPIKSFYSGQLSNNNVGDTIDWYISAIDCGVCGDTAFSPQRGVNQSKSYYTYWIEQPISNKCGISTPNSYPYIIDSFAYEENFEQPSWVSGFGSGASGTSHRGVMPVGNPPSGLNWTPVPNTSTSGFGWCVRSGSTPSAATGPLQGHGLNSNYLYVEASQGSYNDFAHLQMPCVDLTKDSCAVLEFYIHMYGQDIYKLHVDIDTSDVLPYLWQNSVWEQVGQVQTSPQDDWQKVSIPLSNYAGKIIKIRFFAHRGNGDRGDIAIDDIRVYNKKPNDVSVDNLIKPIEGACGYSNKDEITARFSYTGCNTIVKVPVGYKMINHTSNTQVTIWDTIYNPTQGVFDTVFTFSDSLDLSTIGDYSITTFCAMPGDTESGNDTSQTIHISHKSPLNSFPYLCTFDAAPWQAGANVGYNPGVFDTTDFVVYPKNKTANSSWIVGAGYTRIDTTGPIGGFNSTKSQYLFFNDRHLSFKKELSVFQSRCIDFSQLQSPRLSFWYHMYGENCMLYLQVQDQGSVNWTTLTSSMLVGEQQVSPKDKWKYLEVDLSAYAGKQIRVRMVATTVNTEGGDANTAIDNLMIYDKSTKDAMLIDVLSPSYAMNLTPSTAPKVLILNNGTQSLSNIPIKVQVEPICGGSPTSVSVVHAGPVLPGATDTVTFANTPNYFTGEFLLKAYIDMANDAIKENDTLSKYIIGREPINVYNGYFQNFDSCQSFSEGYVPKGDFNAFEVTQPDPQKFNGAHSSPNSLVIHPLDGAMMSQEIVELPTFTGFDSIVDAKLTFWHRFELISNYGRVEYYDFSASKWELLGFEKMNNNSTCDSIYNFNVINTGFYGINFNWEKVCISLSQFNNSAFPLKLRFIAQNIGGSKNDKMYWAIDDIRIEIPRAPNDLSTKDVEFTHYFTEVSDSLHISTQVLNTGMNDVNNYSLNVAIDGVPLSTQSLTAVPVLKASFSEKHNIVIANPGLSPGLHELCVWTANPNGKADDDGENDTTCIAFEILAKSDSYPHCVDFETQQGFLSGNPFVAANDTSIWQYGAPSKNTINSAYSGSNCWITLRQGNYLSDTKSLLYTRPFKVDQNLCYNLSFQHYYKTQELLDGGNVTFSLDTGKTWQVLGQFGDSAWYNQPNVFGLGVNIPGFSGNSNSWQKAFWNGKFAKSGYVIFRFVFATNTGVEDEGWAIDDFCLEEVAGNCTVGIDEGVLAKSISITPNPASNEIVISRVNMQDEYNISLINAEGKLLDEVEFNSERLVYSVANLPSGVYSLVFKNEKAFFVKRIVVQH